MASGKLLDKISLNYCFFSVVHNVFLVGVYNSGCDQLQSSAGTAANSEVIFAELFSNCFHLLCMHVCIHFTCVMHARMCGF